MLWRVRRFCPRPSSFLQDCTNVLGVIGVDHAGIEIEIEASHMLAKDLDSFASSIERASDHVGNDLPADPFHHDGRLCLRDHDVPHQP